MVTFTPDKLVPEVARIMARHGMLQQPGGGVAAHAPQQLPPGAQLLTGALLVGVQQRPQGLPALRKAIAAQASLADAPALQAWMRQLQAVQALRDQQQQATVQALEEEAQQAS
jgi:hypothetical protein